MPKQDATMSTPAHGPGTRKAEQYARPLSERPTRIAKDATGINADQRHPISPKMPHLPPA